MEPFTEPKHMMSGKNPFFSHKRAPRKFKKKWKHIINKHPYLSLNQKLWYIQDITNRDYNQFLITKLIER